MASPAPVFLIIVQRGQTSVFDTFCQEAADRTTVLWDRREGNRRGPWRVVTPERRVAERRGRAYWTAFGFLIRASWSGAGDIEV